MTASHRSAQDIFIAPRNWAEHAGAFVSCFAFYAVMGTLLASLIAWSLILIAFVGATLVSMVADMMSHGDASVGGGIAVGFGIFVLTTIVTGVIGYFAAPFVGVFIGWKAAIAISVTMGLVWGQANTRRYALWLSPWAGAIGALLLSSLPLPESGGDIIVKLGVALSSALSAWLVTWIIRYWTAPATHGVASLSPCSC